MHVPNKGRKKYNDPMLEPIIFPTPTLPHPTSYTHTPYSHIHATPAPFISTPLKTCLKKCTLLQKWFKIQMYLLWHTFTFDGQMILPHILQIKTISMSPISTPIDNSWRLQSVRSYGRLTLLGGPDWLPVLHHNCWLVSRSAVFIWSGYRCATRTNMD